MTIKVAPPELELQGRRVICLAGQTGTDNAPSSVVIHGHRVNGRSLTRACWYRVGRAVTSEDIYWHPMLGLAIEREHSYLVEFDGRGVEWFADLNDYWRLAEDIAQNEALVLAMPYDLHEAFIRTEEELEMDREQDRIADLGKDLAHVAHTEVF